ncbi:hypothetical protein LCGC14_1664520 [marine sediment metagenome]|uniref:DUF6398 domain-containing protein n=1 Tax=marine sediment metagenome TaxID=412755 RepID=A0A0F9HTV9_9ZZZZ
MRDKVLIEKKKNKLIELIDGFCDAYLDDDYKQLCGKLILKMFHKYNVPFLRGLRRKLGLLLNLYQEDDGTLSEKGIYSFSGYKQTTDAIIKSLTEGKTVIIDTSLLEGAEEIFIASIIVEGIFKE